MNDKKRETPFVKIGGREVIMQVTKLFYDKVYEHPWIGQYFAAIPQTHIESQQTDFMSASLGGPKVFNGRMPAFAHEHMMISDELFDLRNQLLADAMQEIGLEPEMQAIWLRIDEAFRKVIVKKNRSDCKKRFASDKILDFEKPKSVA